MITNENIKSYQTLSIGSISAGTYNMKTKVTKTIKQYIWRPQKNKIKDSGGLTGADVPGRPNILHEILDHLYDGVPGVEMHPYKKS